ncbi:hypothetical protein [Kutzneria kofuensis]|uniref:Uncharacterized protein n=1 Tax=Kutzneria kofuensis TaxID=103725 RepID=A0A7W9NGP6_9PSEU|nr:hypothetical protein [Kutzneria kofuensis]MBB5891759.1 hypothetical protein [Kutzneria kofuensis]
MTDRPMRWKTIRPTFVLPQLKKLTVRSRLALGVPALAVFAAAVAVVASVAVQGDPQLAANQADIVNPDCTLEVPANPLSAKGLATPYLLSAAKGHCHETNADQSAFVQATILDPATGKLSVYDPLVIDKGSRPAIAPTPPALPRGAVVGIWFGFNGSNLTLRGDTGTCVNGDHNSVFGQYAYCNAQPFFAAANNAIAARKLVVPPLGTGKDGRPCMTTRDFGLVDQDQSDNVTTTYLQARDGRVAQDTPAAEAKLGFTKLRGKTRAKLTNGSDNVLLDAFVDPALGCTPFTAPDLASGRPVTSLALDELQAATRQAAPIALVPSSDPMTMDGTRTSVTKTNLYRVGVDMPQINTRTETPQAYCRSLVTTGVQRTKLDARFTKAGPSPDPAAASNLFTFLAQRLQGTFDNLGCGKLLHMRNPVHVVTNKAGVVVDAGL